MPLSPISQPGSSGRLPTAPTNITATAVSGGEGSTGSASVSWTASSNPGRATGTYVVRSYDSSNNPGPTASVSASATSVSVTGLTIGTDYTFKVELQSPYGLISDQSSATPSSIRAFARPTISANTNNGGTSISPSSFSVDGKTDTWTKTTGSIIGTVSGAKNVAFAKVSGSGSQTITQSGNEASITGLVAENSYVFQMTGTTSRATGIRVTTSVNPKGKNTTVSVSWGYGGVYTTYNATVQTVGGTTIGIGNGSSDVSTTWVLSDDANDRTNSETLYVRVTATNGTDTARTTDSTHTTVASSSLAASTPTLKTQKSHTWQVTGTTATWVLSNYKTYYQVSPVLSNITLVGAGGGGGWANDAMAGGGGGGQLVTNAAYTPTGNLFIAGGSGGTGDGGISSIYKYSDSSNLVSAAGGKVGGGGASSANGGNSGNSSRTGGASAVNTSGGTYFYYLGGGGAGDGANGNAADTVNVRPGSGGSGTSGVGGGGGGSGQLTPYTTWTYWGAAGGAGGGGAGGGAGGTSSTHAGNGTAGTGGGGGGQAQGGVGYYQGNGGSGYVYFTFDGNW